MRGIAEAVRGVEPVMFGSMLSDVDIYVPSVSMVTSEEHIKLLVARARAEGLPLTVSIGHVGIFDSASVFKKLKESGEFELMATLWGLDEAQFTHYIFRLRQAPRGGGQP